MKNIIIMFFLIAVSYSYCQSKDKKIRKNKMEYFNIDRYVDWEIDSTHSSTERRKFLKKGNERIRISFWEDGIQVRIKNTMTPYQIIKAYSAASKQLTFKGACFYEFYIGKDKEYDETGKLINETDNDKPYKFSLKEVIEKVKKEYGFDLEDLTQRCVLERFETGELDDKPFYVVYLRNKEDSNIINYILLDGSTGETLFKTDMALNGEGDLPPYYKYMESLKKATEEGDEYFTTYKGKKYTKREWKAYEEEWYKNHQEKKNSKRFWDDLFKKP